MNPTPTYTLPACPVCSTIYHLERPHWHHAKNTSHARGVDCYGFAGCKHAEAVGNPAKFRSDPAEWALVEEAWAIEIERLFEAHTEKWTRDARERHRRTLADRMYLPGATEPLNLTPEDPAQPKS